MRRISLLAAIAAIGLMACLVGTGCGSTGNPFAGSQWDVGVNHISFSHGVAQWDTINNELHLKFDLLSGTSYPNAEATVVGVTTLRAGDTRDADVHIAISQGVEYECIAGDTQLNATVTFTQLDLNPLGAVSGTIQGTARRIGVPSELPVDVTASFNDIVVTN